MKMRFREDGTFKIMQITDMQEIPAISKDTIALMERAVLEEQPDLVVYTGDQIKGYGVTYKEKRRGAGAGSSADDWKIIRAGDKARDSVCGNIRQS